VKTGKPDFLDRIAKYLILAVGLFSFGNAAFMIMWPLGWYVAIPTVITTGPPNKHFIQDIGIAYAVCGAILTYASFNIHMRWLAALAGALFLSFHGALHIYEVSVGICSPDVFIADVPGVLGPPILIFVVLGILFARQRITPAGLPKSAVLKVISTETPDESEYMQEIADAPGRAFEKMMAFAPAASHRHDASAELFHAARIGATLAEDCGPCAITAAKGALTDGVSRDKVNLMLEGKESLPDDEALAFQFGQAIATQSTEAFELGDKIEAQYGRGVRFELAMTAAVVRSYPAMKRGLGLTRSCSLSKMEV